MNSIVMARPRNAKLEIAGFPSWRHPLLKDGLDLAEFLADARDGLVELPENPENDAIDHDSEEKCEHGGEANSLHRDSKRTSIAAGGGTEWAKRQSAEGALADYVAGMRSPPAPAPSGGWRAGAP